MQSATLEALLYEDHILSTGSGSLLTKMLTDMARASNFAVRQPSQMQSLQWLHVSAVTTERRSTVPFSRR